eukprot:2227242-Prorocentrum_lima.AAC.1
MVCRLAPALTRAVTRRAANCREACNVSAAVGGVRPSVPTTAGETAARGRHSTQLPCKQLLAKVHDDLKAN